MRKGDRGDLPARTEPLPLGEESDFKAGAFEGCMENLKDQRELELRGLRFARRKFLQMKSGFSSRDGGSGDERTSKYGLKLKIKFFRSEKKYSFFFSSGK